jgi:hypothetical protein
MGALFFVVLCVGGFLGAYRFGHKQGYADGLALPCSEKVRPHAYFVGDLAGPGGQYSVKDVEKMLVGINPMTWEGTGGPASIDVLYDRNKQPVLVITQSDEMHESISSLFSELRTGE